MADIRINAVLLLEAPIEGLSGSVAVTSGDEPPLRLPDTAFEAPNLKDAGGVEDAELPEDDFLGISGLQPFLADEVIGNFFGGFFALA